MKKWIIFSILCILTFSVHEISAIPYQYSVDPLTLTWTTVTNAIAMDTDKNGYADQLYQYTSSPPNFSFTKILGNGDASGTLALPLITGTQSLFTTLNTDGEVIYVGSGVVSGSNSKSALNYYNVTSGSEVTNALSNDFLGQAGTVTNRIQYGFTGLNNEPVLASVFESSADANRPAMYYIRNSTDTIHLEFDRATKGVGSQDGTPNGIAFSTNGTKMYILGSTNDRIYQYTLSDPWESSTANYDSVSFLVSGQSLDGVDLQVNDDGTKFYVLDSTDTIYQYDLSTAWNIATASYSTFSKSVTAQDTTPTGFYFKSDGTKMYVLGQLNDNVYQYSLSTAWRVSTASYDSVSFAIAQDTLQQAISFKNDGSKMYMLGDTNDKTYQYTLATPWVLSTASYDSLSTINEGIEATKTALFIDPSGSILYYLGTAIDVVVELQCPTNWIVTGCSFVGGSSTYGTTMNSVWSDTVNPFTIDSNFNQFTNFLPSTISTNTGVCNASGCITNATNTPTFIKPLTTFTSNGAYVDANIQMYNAGMELPFGDEIQAKKTYWYEYLPVPTGTNSDAMKLLHYNILNPSLTSDAYRFIFDDGTSKYIMYVTGTSIAYAPFNDTTLDNHSIGYYLPDTITDAMDTALTTAVIPVISFDIVTPTSRLTESFGGLFSLISGYQAETASTVVRIIDSRMDNSTAIIPWTVGLSASQIQLTALVKNAPADSAVMVQDTTSKFLTEKYKWDIDYIKADKTFSVDLPYPKCVDIYIKDLTSLGLPWDYVGNLCNTGTMPKTIVYTTNLSFTFYSLPYGVAHTFTQPSALTTTVRHDTLPYNYTIKVYDSTGALQYNNEFQETVTNIDTQTVNTTGISLPAMLKVYDVNDNQIYYSSLGVPSYFSGAVTWFSEWLTIEGFNLLFMLPIVFGAMFTRNTVGIGTMSTVVLIATLTWFGVLPIPDIAIYLMIFIAVIGIIAYKKMYD